ncbi:MAG TPA: hypothetical protein VGS07_18715 [Thermoanaerobaculia bacterium]|jgi:hypothetical protein|nr:hypothetical protein [Thermoanaerobaculia bacterium]
MASKEPTPDVWNDDARTVFYLPPSLTAPIAPAPAAEPETVVEAPEDPEDQKVPETAGSPGDDEAGGEEPEIPFPWHPSADRPPARDVEETAFVAQTAVQEVPFDRPGTTRVGLLGGKGVGKSYLFQAMIYRTLDGKRSGALSYYLDRDTVRVYQTHDRKSVPRSVIASEFIDEYRSWLRLGQTNLSREQWYRLRLQFRTGLLGKDKSFLDVDFLDGSGESFEAGISAEREETWKAAFLDAGVMVFCLPLWAAFPAAGDVLSEDDWEERENVIRGFDAVIRHFRDLRENHQATHPVRSILALTMADDRRSALTTLRNRWITPFLEDPRLHLDAMRTASGVARYLASARKVSEALGREFDASQDPRISGLPERIDFGAGRSWFVPLSAIDGATLDSWEKGQKKRPRSGLRPPVPVHVELPLLVALCESHNALM